MPPREGRRSDPFQGRVGMRMRHISSGVSHSLAAIQAVSLAAWGKMLKIGTQGVGTGSDFFHQAPYIKGYLSVLSLLFQGMVGGQHRTSPFAGELLAVSFVAENS